MLHVADDGQQGRPDVLAQGRQGQFACPSVTRTHDTADPAFLLEPFDDAADRGAVVGDHLRDAGLVRSGMPMNGIERRELDRRQVEAGRLGALDEDLRRLLMQSPNEVSGHVE